MLLQESANMEQSVPENLSTHVVFNDCEMKSSHDPAESENGSNSNSDLPTKESLTQTSVSPANTTTNSNSTSTPTKVKLSFSVDRLLSSERLDSINSPPATTSPGKQCCDGGIYACCTYPNCFNQSTETAKHPPVSAPHGYAYAGLDKFYPNIYNMAYKSVLRPMPLRVTEHATTFPTLATNALLRFHQQHHQHQQQQQQQQHLHHPQQQQHQHKAATLLHSSASVATMNSLKTLQLTQQQRFLAKTPQQQLLDIPTTSTGAVSAAQNGGHTHSNNGNIITSSSNSNHNNNNNNNGNSSSAGSNNNNNSGKRKRSWSRAVFTNLQRKGLEIQFQQQKYITKPDRRKLAARLNLTDAQVKVWFQNRRMKWRHTRENLKSGQEKQPQLSTGASPSKPMMVPNGSSGSTVPNRPLEALDYSSDSCSSVDLSEKADDDDNIEIDVVE